MNKNEIIQEMASELGRNDLDIYESVPDLIEALCLDAIEAARIIIFGDNEINWFDSCRLNAYGNIEKADLESEIEENEKEIVEEFISEFGKKHELYQQYLEIIEE
jgi:hypothetical protein